MSTYDDYGQPPRRRRDDRPPYPAYDDDQGRDDRRSRPVRTEAPTDRLDVPPVSGSQVGKAPADIPPPPLGSAMKREGSRTRAPNLKPDFPDEASYLDGRSPDLERKNGDRDRRFRERRDGYKSDEGEALRGDPGRQRSGREQPRQRPPYDDDDGDRAARRPAASEAGSSMPVRERQRDRGARSEGEDNYERRRPREQDDRRRPPPRDYDDRPRRPRDADPYYDEDPSTRRRGARTGVEYGAEPIRPSRRDDEAGRRPERRSRRYEDDNVDDDEDDSKQRRRKSVPPPRKSDKYDNDDDYYDREPARRRRDDYEREPRRPARRRSQDDDDDYYRRRDDRDRRDRRDARDDRRKEPTSMKIGKTDIGPALDKGQKYYASLAPILTPIVMNYLKNRK